MYKIKLSEVTLGSVLAEPIIVNNILLLNKGVTISKSVQKSLERFGVQEVAIEGIFNESIDTSKLSFDRIDNLTYIAIKSLDIHGAITCAKSLVAGVVNNKHKMLTRTLYDYDESTYQHSLNVADISVMLGIKIGLKIQDLETLAIGAILHDIGKLAVSKEILNKKGKLTEEEIETIKTHPGIGATMVENELGPNHSPIIQIIKQHHEDFDGTGYPLGIKEFEGYRLARIVHIVDVYEALCAKRSYKEPIPRQAVWEIMDGYKGTKFDPLIYKKFREVMPMYLIGEEILIGEKTGVIVRDGEEKDNPYVFVDGNISLLKDLQSLSKEELESIKQTDGILQLDRIW